MHASPSAQEELAAGAGDQAGRTNGLRSAEHTGSRSRTSGYPRLSGLNLWLCLPAAARF